jgi:hypothetical protein
MSGRVVRFRVGARGQLIARPLPITQAPSGPSDAQRRAAAHLIANVMRLSETCDVKLLKALSGITDRVLADIEPAKRPERTNPADVAIQFARLQQFCPGEAIVVERLINGLVAKYDEQKGGA